MKKTKTLLMCQVILVMCLVTITQISHFQKIALSLSNVYKSTNTNASIIPNAERRTSSRGDNINRAMQYLLGVVARDNKSTRTSTSTSVSASDNGSVSANDFSHPIDEFVHKETTQGSSLHTLLTPLKNHSLPEAYGDEISTEKDIATESSRCARYGYKYDPAITKRRRRIFMGSLIADDTWHVIAAHAAEAYGLYHTVALIESNTTQTMTARETRFDEGSLNRRIMESGIFGPQTDVYVDFRVDVAKDYPDLDPFRRENLQRSHITQRWKEAGMQPDDIGIVCDIDEVFTRDFLLALQTCDVPQFRPGQDCQKPEITGQGLTFEIGPDCAFPKTFNPHPQAIIGECVDKIGDSDIHTPGLRKFQNDVEGGHLIGKRKHYVQDPNRTTYPLWEPWDFRRAWKEQGYREKDNNNIIQEDSGLGHTAYHFHDFFSSFEVFLNKYNTYAHAGAGGDDQSFPRAAQKGIACIKGEPVKQMNITELEGGRRPIMFEHKSYRTARLKELSEEVDAYESSFGNDSR